MEIPTGITGTPGLLPRMGSRLARLGGAFLRGCEVTAEPAFRGSGIDVAFEAGEYFGARFPIPARHLRSGLPESSPAAVLLLARALADVPGTAGCDSWAPHDPAVESGRRTRLPASYLAVMARRWSSRSPCRSPKASSPNRRYRAPRVARQYFYLPNQFWQHKNHRVVIDALAIATRIRRRKWSSQRPAARLTIAILGLLRRSSVTGSARSGLRSASDFSGSCRHQDVPQLALQSVAVVNPSLFEGWSTRSRRASRWEFRCSLRTSVCIASRPATVRDISIRISASAPRLRCSTRGVHRPSPPHERLASASEDAADRSREFAGRLSAALARAASAGAACPSRCHESAG